MKTIRITTALFLALFFAKSYSQNPVQAAEISESAPVSGYKFSISTTWLCFDNFGPEETNVHLYEIHAGYKITSRDKIGIKAATWKLFGPMGIPFWDPLFMNESEFFPGRLRESGIGVTYQRMLWKGLFTSVEILPLLKTYLDENDQKIANGFKLYTTFHLGYHVPLLKERMFIEPQIHCNYWPVDTNIPQGFKEKESKWNNYFLFEPNLYLGVSF